MTCQKKTFHYTRLFSSLDAAFGRYFFEYLGFFFLGFWAKVFFGSLGGVKICFYLMAYGSFRLLDLLTLNFGYGFQAIWTLKMAFLSQFRHSTWRFDSVN
ncbi:unnamed protein product [Rhizophagus irregularis]|nr:unnamed protein product [Rhizophagus irregularis]